MGVAAGLPVCQHVFPVAVVPALNAHVVGHKIHHHAHAPVPAPRADSFRSPASPPSSGLMLPVVGHVVAVGATGGTRPHRREIQIGDAQPGEVGQEPPRGRKIKILVELQAVGGGGDVGGGSRGVGAQFGQRRRSCLPAQQHGLTGLQSLKLAAALAVPDHPVGRARSRVASAASSGPYSTAAGASRPGWWRTHRTSPTCPASIFRRERWVSTGSSRRSHSRSW